MPFAVELTLDVEAGTAVRHLWHAVADAGVADFMLRSGAAPHVTLAVYDDLDVEAYVTRLGAFAAATAPQPVRFASLGVFPNSGVVFLAPLVTPALLAVHARFHAEFAPPGASWAHYLPGQWVPHCTLAMELAPDAIAPAVEVCRHAALPLAGRLVEVGVIEFRPVAQRYAFALTGGTNESD